MLTPTSMERETTRLGASPRAQSENYWARGSSMSQRLLALLVMALSSCPIFAAQPAPRSIVTRQLFDGRSLDGWIQVPPDSWVVKDGAMASTGAGRGMIYTAEDYGKFRLLFTMRHLKSQEEHHACVLIFCQRPAKG